MNKRKSKRVRRKRLGYALVVWVVAMAIFLQPGRLSYGKPVDQKIINEEKTEVKTAPALLNGRFEDSEGGKIETRWTAPGDEKSKYQYFFENTVQLAVFYEGGDEVIPEAEFHRSDGRIEKLQKAEKQTAGTKSGTEKETKSEPEPGKEPETESGSNPSQEGKSVIFLIPAGARGDLLVRLRDGEQKVEKRIVGIFCADPKAEQDMKIYLPEGYILDSKGKYLFSKEKIELVGEIKADSGIRSIQWESEDGTERQEIQDLDALDPNKVEQLRGHGWEITKSDRNLVCAMQFNKRLKLSESDKRIRIRMQDYFGHKNQVEKTLIADISSPKAAFYWADRSAAQGEFVNHSLEAIVKISDRHPDPDRTRVIVSIDGGTGKKREKVFLPKLANSEIVEIPLRFDEDGSYQVRIEAFDRLGNRTEQIFAEGSGFTIDTVLEGLDAEVMPLISRAEDGKLQLRAQDRNLKQLKYHIKHFGSDGISRDRTEEIFRKENNFGESESIGESNTPENNILIKGAIKNAPEFDGIYLIEAVAEDRAGNVKKLEKQFRVNRFGTKIAWTGKLRGIGATAEMSQGGTGLKEIFAGFLGYFREADGFTWSVENPSQLRSRSFEVTRDGKPILFRLEENQKNSPFGWYQVGYRILLPKDPEDGHYRISFRAEDEAGHRQEFGDLCQFYIDRKSPEILLSPKQKGYEIRDAVGLKQIQVIEMKRGRILEQRQFETGMRRFSGAIGSELKNTALVLYAEDFAGNFITMQWDAEKERGKIEIESSQLEADEAGERMPGGILKADAIGNESGYFDGLRQEGMNRLSRSEVRAGVGYIPEEDLILLRRDGSVQDGWNVRIWQIIGGILATAVAGYGIFAMTKANQKRKRGK